MQQHIYRLGLLVPLVLGACVVEQRDDDGDGSGPFGSGPTPTDTEGGESNDDSSTGDGDDSTGPDSDPSAGPSTDPTDDPTAGPTTDPTTDPTDPTGDPTGDPTDPTGGDPIDIAPNAMIDDLEDGDPVIANLEGRVGAWYTYNDASAGASQSPAAGAMFTPTAGGASGSAFHANTTGSGFAEWGAGMGLDLNNPGDGMGGAGIKGTYDASGYGGIAFSARGNAAVRVKLQVEAIVPTAEGGTCADMCDDAHGATIQLTGDWVQYSVTFAEAAQEGWGTVASFDAATLMGLQFQSPANTQFEIAIDSVGFF